MALRRYQSRIASLHRWCWFLRGNGQKKSSARKEIADCEDTRLVSDELKTQIGKSDPRVLELLRDDLYKRLKRAPRFLEEIANRILPLRGRSWQWKPHPDATSENPLHLLTQSGPSKDSKGHPVWLRGQRGLSFKRVGQIGELRKRCQALNQSLRRAIGDKPFTLRDESIPDPCPGLLEKLKHIKEQRVNQTAHLILAEALGLRLTAPAGNKRELRRTRDQHGAYEKILAKDGQWIGPADFIVIEDLSRYRANQGRAPRENFQLMKWCHRAVRDKLRELCEVFGLPVLETPAAYSSRFCSRSGVPGFRAVEVTAGFSQQSRWAWIANKTTKDGKPTEEARRLCGVDNELKEAQRALEQGLGGRKRATSCPKRTLLVPWTGGPIFIPAVEFGRDATREGGKFCGAVVQADVNAAINLALRAVADPRLWDIHPRLRTERATSQAQRRGRKKKTNAPPETGAPQEEATVQLKAREKRKYGANESVLSLGMPSTDSAVKDTRNPNYFTDVADVAKCTSRKPYNSI